MTVASWKKVKLESISGDAGIFVDGDWVESKDQDPSGKVRLTQLADIGVGEFLDRSSRFLTSEKAAELKCTFLEPGDVLVARMPDPIGRACIFPGDNRPCVTVVDVCIIRPDPNSIHNRWLMWIINSPRFKHQLEQYLSGTTRQRISRKNLQKLEIPLPPLKEQRRIAAILDKADAVRRKRKEAIALTEELLRSAFLEMFGEQHQYPRMSVGEICKVKGGKRLPVGEQLIKENTGYPYIQAGNLKQGTVTGEILYLTEEIRERIKRYTISSQDVYITIVGAYIGDVGIVPTYLDGANLTENAAKLVLRTEKVKNHFLSHFLRSELGQRQIKSKIKTTGQPKFALFRIEEMQVPIPPLELQERFQSIVWSSQANLEKSKSMLVQSDNLFNSLLQRAFRGEL